VLHNILQRGDKSWVDSFFGPVVSGLNYISVCGERITALALCHIFKQDCEEREMVKRKGRACAVKMFLYPSVSRKHAGAGAFNQLERSTPN
jgi:hypothetical protein